MNIKDYRIISKKNVFRRIAALLTTLLLVITVIPEGFSTAITSVAEAADTAVTGAYFDTDGMKIVTYNVVNDFGAITTSSDMDFNRRLKVIYDDMTEIITTYKPDEMGIEKLFFNTNEKTAIDVAQARGVTLLPAIIRNIPIYEYTPLQVKCSIVGYGRAEKKQVQEMTKTMLHLKAIPKPDDTADAEAIAITHGLSVNTRRVMKNFEEK